MEKKTVDYFSLIRHGVINLKGRRSSKVQCAGVKHQFYKYGVGILYAEGLTLDVNGWLIDNNAIDAIVQKAGADSCEKMLVNIKNNILKLLQKHGIPFMGFKILLRPFVVTDEKVAEFTLNVIMNENFRSDIISLRVELNS